MSTKTRVNWPDLETAFERNAPGLQSYLERATGEVISVFEGDPADAELAAKIAAGPDSYIRLDPASSQEQYRWMEQFLVLLEPGELRDRLMVAIDGKGAFRRFKDVLLSYPIERDRWFNYRADLLHYYITRWLQTKAIEADPPPPWGEVHPPEQPTAPLVRPAVESESPIEALRRQTKALVDTLAAGELHSARAFLEYLRDRGRTDPAGKRGRLDLRRPFRRPPSSGTAAADGSGQGDPAAPQPADEDSDA